MPTRHAQIRAKLLWEVTCERLRNTLEPPKGAPEVSAADRLEALRLAQEALELIQQAFKIAPLRSQQSIRRKPDGEATEARTS